MVSAPKHWKINFVPLNLYCPRAKWVGEHHSEIFKVIKLEKPALLFSPRLREDRYSLWDFHSESH